MFEKFSNLNVDSSGSGGEYTVQAGFGWTNGVVLWVASTYGEQLVAPQCPELVASATSTSTGTASTSTSTSTGTAVGVQVSISTAIVAVAISVMASVFLS
jgi:alpha,alpha-trehalase